jgi:hypothetical protein
LVKLFNICAARLGAGNTNGRLGRQMEKRKLIFVSAALVLAIFIYALERQFLYPHHPMVQNTPDPIDEASLTPEVRQNTEKIHEFGDLRKAVQDARTPEDLQTAKAALRAWQAQNFPSKNSGGGH